MPLAGLRRAAIQPDIHPAAVGIQFVGIGRAGQSAKVDDGAETQGRIGGPDAVGEIPHRAVHMEIQARGIDKQRVGIRIADPSRIQALQVGQGRHIRTERGGIENVARAFRRRVGPRRKSLAAHDDAGPQVGNHRRVGQLHQVVGTERNEDRVFDVIAHPERAKSPGTAGDHGQAVAKFIGPGRGRVQIEAVGRVGDDGNPLKTAELGAAQRHAFRTANGPEV